MVLFYVGIAHIPLFVIGGILNTYVLYCLLKFKKKNNNLQFGNLERLLLALNISDLLTCIVAVPIKIALYIIIKDTENSPIQKFSYLVDLFCQFSSVLITTMVAVNNCIKITRFSSYDSLMTSRRVNNFIRATFIISTSTISLPILFSPALVLIILILTIVTALIV